MIMDPNQPSLLKKWLDKFLVINLFVIIGGAFLFLGAAVSSLNGHIFLYKLFQQLWFPLFIPALSLFFTAVLVEALLKNKGS